MEKDLDLSKVFDDVVNPDLLTKLQMHGCSSSTLLCFKSDNWSKHNRRGAMAVMAEIVTDD